MSTHQNLLIKVENLEYGTIEEYFSSLDNETTTLIGYVEGLGDWDFNLMFPYFFGPKIPLGAKTSKTYWEEKPVFPERIDKAFVALGPDNKPERLLIFGERFVKDKWVKKSVMYYFQSWPEDFIWVQPE